MFKCPIEFQNVQKVVHWQISLVNRRYRYNDSSSLPSQWLSFSEQLEESVFLTEVHKATLVTGGQALLFLHSTTDSLTFALCIWIFRLDVHCTSWCWNIARFKLQMLSVVFAMLFSSCYICTLMKCWLIYKEMLASIYKQVIYKCWTWIWKLPLIKGDLGCWWIATLCIVVFVQKRLLEINSFHSNLWL